MLVEKASDVKADMEVREFAKVRLKAGLSSRIKL